MLNGERVVLRPIQRGDLPRLWELISDFEVAVLGSSGPVVPRSLAQFEAGFDQDLKGTTTIVPISGSMWTAS